MYFLLDEIMFLLVGIYLRAVESATRYTIQRLFLIGIHALVLLLDPENKNQPYYKCTVKVNKLLKKKVIDNKN